MNKYLIIFYLVFLSIFCNAETKSDLSSDILNTIKNSSIDTSNDQVSVKKIPKPIKVIIMNFSNISQNKDNDYIKSIITDNLKTEINLSEKFIFVDNVLSDAESFTDLLRKCLNDNIDIIISGYYIEKNGKIYVYYKIIDVFTNLTIMKDEITGDSFIEIIELLRTKSIDLIMKMNKEIKKHPDNDKIGLKMAVEKTLSYNKSLYKDTNNIFITSSALYTGTGFINTERNTDYDNILKINSNENSYYNYSTIDYNFQFYKKYINNAYGVGFDFLVPFFYDTKNVFMNTRIGLSTLVGFQKNYYFIIELFFKYSAYKKSFSITNDNLKINMSTIGFNFNFRYLPENKPFFIEGGLGVGLPFKPTLSINDNDFNFFDMFGINTNFIDNKSFYFPVNANISGGYFFNDNLGIFTKLTFDAFAIDYNSNMKYIKIPTYFNYKMDFSGNNFGIDLGLNFNIIFGLCLKAKVM